MTRPLRRQGRGRAVLTAGVSMLWAYVWLLPVVLALRLDGGLASAVLLSVAATFLVRYVVGPLRSRQRSAAQFRLRSCRRYLPWLTAATATKLLLMFSTLALHEQLAALRVMPRLPNDADIAPAAFLEDPLAPLALVLAVGVTAPLIEEFAFRGRMLHTLEHAFGVIPAIVVSAVAFSLLHGRLDAIHHLPFGLFAGWVVWQTGSIWAAVYMHALNNIAAQLMLYVVADSSASLIHAEGVWPYAIAGTALGLGGLIAAGMRIRRLATFRRPAVSLCSTPQAFRAAASSAR